MHTLLYGLTALTFLVGSQAVGLMRARRPPSTAISWTVLRSTGAIG